VPYTKLFKGDRLNTAVYLQQLLSYVRTRRVNHFKVEFVFENVERKAAEIEINFESGASLPVTSDLASFRFLRKAITSTEIEHRDFQMNVAPKQHPSTQSAKQAAARRYYCHLRSRRGSRDLGTRSRFT
jgi:hypothetical protein